MIWRLDPHRPGVDTDDIRCPDCDQTYTAILGGFVSLPAIHYRQPTTNRIGKLIVGTAPAGGQQGLCSATGDDLAAYGFRAQVAAELEQRKAAA